MSKRGWWWQRWLETLQPQAASRRAGRQRLRFLPRLEQLEDRLTPSTTFSIADSGVLEPAPGGTIDLDFTATRSGDLTSQLTVGFITLAGTAQPNTDFTPTTGTTTFAPGSATATIAIPVFGNGVFNTPSLTFSVELTGIVNALVPRITLGPQTTLTAGFNPVTVALADFNGDSKPDLAFANVNSNSVSVFLNTTAPGAATASFGAQQAFAADSGPGSVTVTDLNGDGKPDVIVVNTISKTVSVLLNTTAPGAPLVSFATQHTFATGTRPTSVAVGDVNDDGKPDLVVGNADSTTVSVLLNTTVPGATTASFATQQTFATGADPNSVALADLNGDGKPDLVVANEGDNTVSVLLNETAPGAATTSFATQQTFAAGTYPSSVALADLNGDGKPDVIVTNAGGSSVSVLLNETAPGATTPSFAAQKVFATGNDPEFLAVGDLNGDGKPDLLVSNLTAKTVSVLLNTTAPGATAPSFATQQTFAIDHDPTGVAVGDLNGDGQPDLIVTTFEDVSVFLNTTALGEATITPEFPEAVTSATGTTPFSVTVADLNGDGRPDLAVTNADDNTVSVLLSTTVPGVPPSFATQQTFATGLDPQFLTSGDVNGDGRPDLIVANSATSTVSVLLNTTAPGATTPSFATQQTFATGFEPVGVALGDINGDGKADLVVANANDNTLSVLLNTTAPGATSASFATQLTFATGSFPISVAVGDVNGDGRADLVCTNSASNTVSVLINTTTPGAGTPSFATQKAFATGNDPFGVALGDVNGDGKADLIVTDFNDQIVSVLLNRTTPGAPVPSFATQQTFATGKDPTSVALSDVNGDGKLDLVVANADSATVSVLLNMTAPGATVPSFATQQTFATGTDPTSVAAADVNGDGRPDLITANQKSNTVSVLLNTPVTISNSTATGTITESDPPPTVQFSSASQSVSESAGTFSLTVTLSDVSGVTTTVPFTLGGTATAGIDYTDVTSGPLLIPAGQTSATISGTLLDDDPLHTVKTLTVKTLTVTLGTPTNATLGTPATTTLTIAKPELPSGEPPTLPSPQPQPPPPPSVSVAFGPFGEVLEVVSPSGILTQFDAFGAQVLGGGVRAASVAFGPGGEELLVTFQTGVLAQFDATGAHVLGGGVQSASIAFGPLGEVIDVVFPGGTLVQFDATGTHLLGGGVQSASVAFGPLGEVIDVVFPGGTLVQFDAAGAHVLGGGVLSASVAFGPVGEVQDVLFADGSLVQFDALGVHPLGAVF